MHITLTNLGKRYNRDWIFRRLDYIFLPGKKYAITGPNGSGKSTLLQTIAGAVSHNEGAIQYLLKNNPYPAEELYRQLSMAAPYLELVEEMTAAEFLTFHAAFKPLHLSVSEILSCSGLKRAADKQIRYYSSGMKQRLKLAQAFFSDTPLLCLDEPTTNLDAAGIALYHELISNWSQQRLLLISSNDPEEYKHCDAIINLETYKPV